MAVDRRFFETLMANKKLSLRALASRMEMKHSHTKDSERLEWATTVILTRM